MSLNRPRPDRSRVARRLCRGAGGAWEIGESSRRRRRFRTWRQSCRKRIAPPSAAVGKLRLELAMSRLGALSRPDHPGRVSTLQASPDGTDQSSNWLAGCLLSQARVLLLSATPPRYTLADECETDDHFRTSQTTLPASRRIEDGRFRTLLDQHRNGVFAGLNAGGELGARKTQLRANFGRSWAD